MFQDRPGIDWNELQLIDVILPALSALETAKSERTDAAVKVRWIKRDAMFGAWYRALSAAMAHVIIDTAKLLVEHFFTLQQHIQDLELPLPAVRKILRSRPTFPYDDFRIGAHELVELVPSRVTTRDSGVLELDVSGFMGVGSNDQIIQRENLRTDNLSNFDFSTSPDFTSSFFRLFPLSSSLYLLTFDSIFNALFKHRIASRSP